MSSPNPVTSADASHNENLNANFTAPSSTNPTTAAGLMTANTGETGSGRISSLASLREESPKLFKAMMDGIARSICNQIKEGQERVKKAMRGQE